MVLKVVPLAKLLPHAHFPVNEDPSRIPSPGDCLLQKSSGLFAYRKRPTIDLKVSKFGSFATCETEIPTFFPKLLYFIVKCGLFMINLPFNSDKNKNNRFAIAFGALCEPIMSVKVGNN